MKRTTAKKGRPATDADRMDPVVRTAIKIAKLQKRHYQLDTMPKGICTEAIYRESEENQVTDRIYILREYLSAIRPTSLAGVLALTYEIGLIIDRGDMHDHEERKIVRMLYAMKDVIKGFIPAQLFDDMDLDADRHLDPWRPYEQRLAMIDDKREAA